MVTCEALPNSQVFDHEDKTPGLVFRSPNKMNAETFSQAPASLGLDTGNESVLISAFAMRHDAVEGQGFDGGNPCRLIALDAAPLCAPARIAEWTTCQSWPTSYQGEFAIDVQCTTPSGETIACCGHGLLAAAWHWQQRLQRSHLKLRMNNSPVDSWREQHETWLRFKRRPTTICEVPTWFSSVFPAQSPPLAAAGAGGEQGYLVLQWPDGVDLKRIDPPLACLAGYTQRALICTAAQPLAGDEAIQLRYFAPQYGVDEDIATGSAMHILADYWAGRFQQLRARQCSNTGGDLLARVSAKHVEVGGLCQRLPGEEHRTDT